ncbi:MAG: ribosome-associated translation inhibitor RaiA [Alphaproteobacteria bacterium]|nr:ribosome-associated translation inhibitor RaiA [Alphaproteobacteria bacterium]
MAEFSIDILFRNMDHSAAVEADIRKKIATLERFADHIVDCRVVVDAPHKHSHKGGLYDVHINIAMPGQDIVINRAGVRDHAHEDIYVAVRDAFDAAVRKLEDHVRKERDNTRKHPPEPS